MQSDISSGATLRFVEEWQQLEGLLVELRFGGVTQRRGRVDTVMPDASGLWLAAHAAGRRTFVDQASGYEIWVSEPKGEGPRDSPDETRGPA